MTNSSMNEQTITADQKLSLYTRMIFYRRFEEKVGMAYMNQKFSGFCHLHIGQEAVCVGVGETTRKEDKVISSYRSHTQAIEKGIAAKYVFAELFGKRDGCARGKGGSMHMFSKELGFLGGHGIVGGQAPIAVGAAFALKYRNEDGNVICYLGDAAMNQGQVFEAMNMAAVWDLPVLFLVENNRYGMGTDISRVTSVDSLTDRALAFGMASSRVDGMDVLSVYVQTAKIMEQMRTDRRPYLLEADTYRFKGHSVSDPATYRSKEEVASYQKLDPILQLGRHLVKEGIASDSDLKEIDANAKEEIRIAEAFADSSPQPDERETWLHVFEN